MLLKDKVIIVTGASSGIGAAAAVEVARQGARVVLAARREAEGAAVAQRIREGGGQAIFVRTDVSRPADIEALVARTLEEHGRLDGAFNNAGIPGPFAPLADIDVDEYRRLMTVNLDAIFLCMKHEIPAMKRTGGGAIVNCASIMGIVGGPTFSPYTAAKHGVVAMTKVAALDYALDNIRVNAVMPGPVDTEIWSHMKNGQQILEAFIAGVPMKRKASPEEIARPVAFLLSDGASYITGAALPIDGGYVQL